MNPNREPTPPTRRDEDFPKTTTLPSGWVMPELMDYYNTDPAGDPAPARRTAAEAAPTQPAVPVTAPPSGIQTAYLNGQADQPAVSEPESPFARQLDPTPAAWNQTGTWL